MRFISSLKRDARASLFIYFDFYYLPKYHNMVSKFMFSCTYINAKLPLGHSHSQKSYSHPTSILFPPYHNTVIQLCARNPFLVRKREYCEYSKSMHHTLNKLGPNTFIYHTPGGVHSYVWYRHVPWRRFHLPSQFPLRQSIFSLIRDVDSHFFIFEQLA